MITPSPGDVLAGKFRIERVLGEGGMGIVLSAHHLHLGRSVAIKLLRPEALAHKEIVARFANEAKSASRIQSEHVARVLDVGALEGGEPYMVMEYLEGSDLSKVVRKQGPLPIEDAVEYLLQACEALAEAHVAGIVHRDLKPANLYLTRRADGSACVKVLDFGISKAALAGDQAVAQNMTQTASVLGTPGYMAPEQLRSSKHVDARTDIWALGVILHELLTGRLAFQGSTVPEVYAAILSSPPEPLRQGRPDAPPALEAAIMRCLEKEPTKRYASVGELAAALLPFAPERARLSAERIGRITGVSLSAVPARAAMPSAQPTQQGMGAPGYPAQMGAMAAYSSAPTGIQPPSGPPIPTGFGQAQPMQQAQSIAQAQQQQQQQAYGQSAATPPGYYGQQPQTPLPYQQGYGQQQAAAMQQDPNKGKMHPSTIALLAVLGVIVVTFGGCMTCVCIGAAGQ